MTRGNVGCLFAAVAGAVVTALLWHEMYVSTLLWHVMAVVTALFATLVLSAVSLLGLGTFVVRTAWLEASRWHRARHRTSIPVSRERRREAVQRRTPPPVREDIPVVDGALPGPEQRPAGGYVPPSRYASPPPVPMPTVPDGALDAWQHAVASPAAPGPTNLPNLAPTLVDIPVFTEDAAALWRPQVAEDAPVGRRRAMAAP